MSVLDKLTEGIVNRDLQKEGAALLNKWENTGLLEGLDNDTKKDAMARLLENQAKELLREASSMAAGADVEGFASVAFPIVRRVFGNLIANDLVSVQPMSLPSGLIFFLDFTYGDPGNRLDYEDQVGKSIYGGGQVAKGLQNGVSLDFVAGADNAERGFYALNNGFASPTGSDAFTIPDANVMAGIVGSGDEALDKAVRYDPDLSGSAVVVFAVENPASGDALNLNLRNFIAMSGTNLFEAGDSIGDQVRRLTSIHTASTGDLSDPTNASLKYKLVYRTTGSATGGGTPDYAANAAIVQALETFVAAQANITIDFPLADNFDPGGALGSVVGATPWQLESEVDIPEIDIKVDSVAVTAMTKKLKAKWTPELGQDLNAYHNLDAEVELTSILSEQIALEIDREILEDLIKGATAGTQYWSRRPGRFLNRDTGGQIGGNLDNESLMGADFTGTVSEWYETLAETINDVSAQIHRKTLRGGANFVVCSPEVANILEFTAGFRASIGNDYGNGSIGAVNVGSLSKKYDVYVDPYFPRNVILVGRKGGSFLESGYVYAPYVPLQVTPTIFGVEDFVPRKGVMTRYAKKMVRPDMYGLVICRDLNG
jgi:hypothetical protein